MSSSGHHIFRHYPAEMFAVLDLFRSPLMLEHIIPCQSPYRAELVRRRYRNLVLSLIAESDDTSYGDYKSIAAGLQISIKGSTVYFRRAREIP
jgi:hypothetical protein